MEHVVWQLLEVVGCKVEDFEAPDLVEIADALWVQFVVGEVQVFEVEEVTLGESWYNSDLVVLQIELLHILEVLQLLQSNLVVRQIQRCQVLEVTQVLLNDVHDLLGCKLRLDGLMGESHPA